MKNTTLEIIGWTGVLILLLSFFFVSFGLIPAKGTIYLSLSFISGSLLMYFNYKREVYQGVVINLLWVFIALSALLNYMIF